nr:cupin domain-containing protein [Liquorilactobacillus satsumensis]
MNYQALNFNEKLNKFSEQWSPKVIAQMNNYQFKVVKIQNDFVWHKHDTTDEVFIILTGNVRIDFRDGNVNLAAGEMFVIPKGKEHKHMQKKKPKFC